MTKHDRSNYYSIMSTSYHEMHNTVYYEAKLNSKGELRCHATICSSGG